MLINTSLSTETAARDLQKSRGAESSNSAAGASGQAAGTDPATARGADAASQFQARFSLVMDGVPEIADAAGADQVTELLRAGLVSQPGTALAAQGNPNPESAYNLLR